MTLYVSFLAFFLGLRDLFRLGRLLNDSHSICQSDSLETFPFFESLPKFKLVGIGDLHTKVGYIAFEYVSGHSSAIADIVSDVIRYDGGISGIVFGNTDQSQIWWSQSTLVLFGAIPHDPVCLTHAS